MLDKFKKKVNMLTVTKKMEHRGRRIGFVGMGRG